MATPLSPRSIRRILVIKLSSLGDLFHALPAVHELKTGFGAVVDWVTQPAYTELVGRFGDVNRVLAFPRRRFLTGAAAFFRDLRRDRYDLIVDFQGLLKSALIARLARGTFRLGPSFHREGAHLFYTAVAGPRNRNRHAVEEALDAVRYLGHTPTQPISPLSFPKRPRTEPRPRVALLPCSRWITKNWPPERFIETARGLLADPGAALFLVGAAEDRPVCDAIANALEGRVVNLCGQTSLVEMGSLLQEMDLVISVDSGPMHMAAALGIPVLAVFGATDPVRTGPYGAKHRVLHHENMPCRPCRSRQCARHDLACLADLPAGRVLAAARAMLASS